MTTPIDPGNTGALVMSDAERWLRKWVSEQPDPDPLLDDLARLLTDPRVPDAYAESVRAELREIAYRMRLVAEKEQAA